jgi:hypothetical protein
VAGEMAMDRRGSPPAEQPQGNQGGPPDQQVAGEMAEQAPQEGGVGGAELTRVGPGGERLENAREGVPERAGAKAGGEGCCERGGSDPAGGS